MVKTGRWVRDYELWKSLKGSPNYRGLPAPTAQQTLRILNSCWLAYFQSIREYEKNPKKFIKEPRFPKYKKEDGEFILAFTNQQVRIKNGKFKLANGILDVRTRLIKNMKLTGARIVPKGVGYMLEITYNKEVRTKVGESRVDTNAKAESSRVIGSDLGLENLIATANNIGAPSIVFKGGPVKSINQYFNKRMAELRNQYARQGIKTGRKLKTLTLKRNRKINNYFHQVSKIFVLYCEMCEIDTIVIGRSKGWKQGINIGRVNNQNFVFVPFLKLLFMIRYKAEEVGIQVIESDEAYTSLCSFLDCESIEKHDVYLGRRITRGLFKTAKGKFINADTNGAFNHLRNAVPNSMVKVMEQVVADGIEGVGIHPVRAVID